MKQFPEDVDTMVGYVDADAVKNEFGAKTGAVAAVDPRLAAIIAAWPSLTEPKRHALAEQAVGDSW